MLNHRELWTMRVLSDRGILQLQGRGLGGRCREYGQVNVDYIHQVPYWAVRGGTRRDICPGEDNSFERVSNLRQSF